MSDLTAERLAFLTARLDEDEQTALAWPKHERSWQVLGLCSQGELIRTGGPEVMVCTGDVNRAMHTSRHDPSRVLAEVDAKRRTLVRCREEMLSGIPRLVHFAEQTIGEMTLPYVDHPDYPRGDAFSRSARTRDA